MFHAVLWQRLEGLIAFAAGIVLFGHWNDRFPWWSAVLIFFVPDLGFLGYLLGARGGAAVYNALHLYGTGLAALVIGLMLHLPWLQFSGALWLAHCGFDRMLGYGLKSPDGFSITHLGRIGKR